MERAQSISEIFMTINAECCTFLNYEILEDLVQEFQLNLDEENSRYPEKLKNYVFKHKIAEFLEVKPILNELTDDTKKIVLLLDIEATSKLSRLSDVRPILWA